MRVAGFTFLTPTSAESGPPGMTEDALSNVVTTAMCVAYASRVAGAPREPSIRNGAFALFRELD